MKTIIKLTNEYASNLNCLFFSYGIEIEPCYNVFDSMFKNCLQSNDIDIAQESSIIDIVFIKIGDSSKFQNQEELKRFIQSLRKEKELLPVFLIKDNIKNTQLLEMIDQCYCLDGIVPAPFDRDKIYRFLYRVLKRIIVEKELNAYVLDLENQLFSLDVVTKEEKKVTPKVINKEREEDIRFSQVDKISAVEFMSSLDDTIVDKVENMNEELDALISILYDIDMADIQNSLILMPKINIIIEEIYILVDSMGTFGVTARAFKTLNVFLENLTTIELEDKDKKNMLVAMLLALIGDLEKWIDVIFIQQTTEDIHYFDASFSSNILEIENLFNDVEEDDDDLEFF